LAFSNFTKYKIRKIQNEILLKEFFLFANIVRRKNRNNILQFGYFKRPTMGDLKINKSKKLKKDTDVLKMKEKRTNKKSKQKKRGKS